MDRSVAELARELFRCREDRKAAEERTKVLKAEEDAAEEQLLKLMETDEITSVEVDGYRFGFSTSIKASVLVENREWLINSLRQRGFGDLVKTAVDPRTLNKFVKDQVEENGGQLPEWMDGRISLFIDRSVSVRKK